MRTLSFMFSILMLASGALAAPETPPSITACKSDLKAWSAQKTEALTLTQLNEHMNEIFACAQETKKHEKQMCECSLMNFTVVILNLRIALSISSPGMDLQRQFGEEEAAGSESKN
jgi:hypothetical protein